MEAFGLLHVVEWCVQSRAIMHDSHHSLQPTQKKYKNGMVGTIPLLSPHAIACLALNGTLLWRSHTA